MKTDKAIMAASLVGTIIVGVVLSYAKQARERKQAEDWKNFCKEMNDMAREAADNNYVFPVESENT